MTRKGTTLVEVIGVVITIVVCLVLTIASFSVWEHLDADRIMVIQSPVAGNLKWCTSPGIWYQGFGRVTKYYKLDTYEFGIPVRFNDGGHGTMVGSLNYELPFDPNNLTQLHTRYGSQKAIQKQLVEVVTNKCVYMTGPLMSSKESYAEKRTSLIQFIEDQIQLGVYKTAQKEVKTTDPMTGKDKTTTVAEIVVSTSGIPLRQEEPVLASYGIRTSNFAVTNLPYDDVVEKQIQTQQKAIMDVQTAIAGAKKAEQDAITAEKNGQAQAAIAKWEQEVIKAKAVVFAEQSLAVAELDRKTAEQKKQEQILLGEGEGERKRLVMVADGALEQKLATYREVNKYWADCVSKYPGAWVPSIVMGSVGAQAGSGANDLINLLTAKTAKDLGLDMTMMAGKPVKN